MAEITLNHIYHITRLLLINNADKEVWISKGFMDLMAPAVEKAMIEGVKLRVSDQEYKPKEKFFRAADYTFIEKPDIKGIILNGKDIDINDLLLLIEPDIERDKKFMEQRSKLIANESQSSHGKE